MTIKGVKDLVTDIQKGSKPAKQKASKPARRKVIKKKMTVYVDVNLIEVLQAYAFQNRKKISAVVEELIEGNLSGKVKKELLREPVPQAVEGVKLEFVEPQETTPQKIKLVRK